MEDIVFCRFTTNIYNMYKLLKLVFLSFCIFFAIACTEDDPSPQEVPQTAEKTIFVFMPYSTNLYSCLLDNITGIKTAIKNNKGLDNTRLVIFIAKNQKQGALIDIKYDNEVCKQDTLEKINSQSYLTTNGRVELLNKVKKYAPAKRYAMIIGCHGMGWLPSSTVFNTKKSRYFGGIESDYRIDIDDLAESIRAAEMKMQFILFDDCYMSSIEVAYELKEATDYLIASTSEIMDKGMPYHRIYQYLMSAEPNYEAVCQNFYDYYSKYSSPYGTIGVTDCKYIDDITAMMKHINTTHTFDTNRLNNVQDLDGDTFTPTIFFDFDDYIRNLCINDNNTYEQFHTLLQRLVPYKATTSYIYSGDKKTKTKVSHFSGITISDPSTRTEIEQAKQQTNWWLQTH